MSKVVFIAVLTLIFGSCNNPFSTRDPEEPGSDGTAIKPPNSPENVLYNLESSFEGLSTLDYMAIFTEDFIFSPDSEDSLKYVEDFRSGWGYEKENQFANNYLQRINFTDSIEGKPIFLDTVSIVPGANLYEFTYNLLIFETDPAGEGVNRIEIEGEAWLYFREDSEGEWYIYRWIDHRLNKNSITWGALRAQNI